MIMIGRLGGALLCAGHLRDMLPRMVLRYLASALLGLAFATARAQDSAAPRSGLSVAPLEVKAFRPAEGPRSGPAVYYQIVEDSTGPFIQGRYRPGMETVAMAIEVPEALRQKARRLRWRWRAEAFPAGGDECRPGYGDSAASVYAAFKRGLKWYILRFVWSSVGHRGAVCDPKRGLLLARDTIVLRSGGAPGTWHEEEIDLRREFRRHFAGTRGEVEVPDFVGVGLMTDGDQTNSESAADYAGFEVLY